MAEPKKIPSLDEALRLKETIAKTGTTTQMDRANQIVLNIKKQQDGDNLVKSTGVTGAGGKEAFKLASSEDQTFKVNVGKPEVISTNTPIKTITGTTPKLNEDMLKVGAKDIWGTAGKKAAGAIATTAKKGAEFLAGKAKSAVRGKLAGAGAFMAGVASALSGGNEASASDMLQWAASAALPPGVQEVGEVARDTIGGFRSPEQLLEEKKQRELRMEMGESDVG